MNQELYSKLIDAATVVDKISRFNKRISAKQKEVGRYNEALAQVSQESKASIGSIIKCIVADVAIIVLGFILSCAVAIASVVMVVLCTVKGGAFFGGNALIVAIVCTVLTFTVSFVLKTTGNVLFIIDTIRFIICMVKGAKVKKSCKAKLEIVKSEEDEMLKVLSEYKEENEKLLDFLPETHQNPKDILCMLKAVNEQKIETLQEALAFCIAD